MDKVIAFPIMGNYHIPANYLFSKITNSKITYRHFYTIVTPC